MRAESIGSRNTISERGSSILEVLIAASILVLSITAATLLVFANQSLKLDSETSDEALYKAKDSMESARARALGDFASVVPILPAPDTIYSKELAVTDVTPCVKEVVGRITWSAEANRPQKIELKTNLADIAGVLALGGDCATKPPGKKWSNPQKFASDNFNPGKPVSIDVLNRTVYMGADTYPFFYIADAGAATPGQSSGLFVNFSNGFTPGYQVNAVDAARWRDPSTGAVKVYVYAAIDSTANQLQVIDVSDIHNPVTVATRSLSPCVIPTGSYPQGWRLYYYKDRLYLVTRETAGPEFHIFDVQDPTNPTELGMGACKGTELTTTINNLVVHEQVISGVIKRFAYAATTLNSGELQVYDVTDPANVGAISEVSAARQDLPGTQDGQSIYLVGNKIYFGRQSTPSGSDFYIYDASHPTTGLLLLGSKDINTGAIALQIVGKFAFIGTPKTNQEFQVWDISNPVNITNVATYSFPKVVENGTDYEPDFVYLTSAASDSLRIIYNP